MSARKRQRLLTAFVDIDSSDTDSVPSFSYSLNTNEEVENKSSYSRAQRKFLPHWKYLFPWVEIDNEEKLYCRECRAAGMKNDFAIGKLRPAKGWKKECLRRHAKTSDHSRFAVQALAIAKTASSVFKTPKLLSSERETMGLLFNVHFLTTNGLSMNKGSPLHALFDFHLSFHKDQYQQTPIEVDPVPEERLSPSVASSSSQFQLSKSHRSTYSTWEFVHALNTVTEAQDVGNLQKARYFSLLLDESTEITCAKNLMIYCQFLNACRNKVELKFMKLLALQECDAMSIYTSVVKYFEKIQVTMDKLIMFTSDGASVMLGCENGV